MIHDAVSRWRFSRYTACRNLDHAATASQYSEQPLFELGSTTTTKHMWFAQGTDRPSRVRGSIWMNEGGQCAEVADSQPVGTRRSLCLYSALVSCLLFVISSSFLRWCARPRCGKSGCHFNGHAGISCLLIHHRADRSSQPALKLFCLFLFVFFPFLTFSFLFIVIY